MYTIDRTVDAPFDETVERTIDALAEEGFGVLADIDVQATFEAKLGESIDQYRILGACNPPLAFEALGEEPRLGTLLPCNVVVYETDDGQVGVSAIDPEEMLGIVGNAALDPIASEVRERFERVLDAVATASAATRAD